MSDYLNKLIIDAPEVADRYKQKISLINNVDPFALEDAKFSSDPAKFPPVTNMDLVTYLVLTTSYYTGQQMKAYKSLSAFKYFEAGFVSGCGVHQIGDYSVIIGKIKHSQRMNAPPVRAWVICETENGSVNTAHCTCMAGLGEVCSHVGALLCATEYIVTCRSNSSCTDVRAMWKVPTTSKVESKPIKDISFGRVINYFPKTNIKPLTHEEIVSILTSIEEAGSSSALMRVVEPFATKIANEIKNKYVELENPYQHLYKEEYEAYSLEELIILASSVEIKMTQEECEKIEKATVNQASSKEWILQRTGRITASFFKQAVKTSKVKPSLSLVKAICYPLNLQFKTKATEWGKNQEKNAIEGYKLEQNLYHDNLQLETVGLCIKSSMPYFGASPDSMVSCTCCGKGCVEIKCPYLLKNKSIEEYCEMKGSCLKRDEDDIHLDKSHRYFYQVQQQMALTSTNYCDFVVWSPEEMFIQRISFNEDFWVSESEKSLEFHKNIIMPELLGKFFTKNISAVATYCFCQTQDDGRPMICCENENCNILWYHLDCLGLQKVPENLWYCSNCE